MAVNKFCIHFLYLSEKRLSLKACIFGSKQMAFVYLAFFDDGTAFPYLPVLPRDFLFGADTLSSLVKEHAAGSNLYIRFGEQPPLAENQMDMIICLALVVVEGGHALHTVPPAELLCKVREYLLRLVLRIDFVLNAKLNKKKNKENSQNKRKSLIKVNE